MISLADLEKFDWFHSHTTDKLGRHVVTVNRMTLDVLTTIPSTVDGKQILVHFAADSKPADVIYLSKVSVYVDPPCSAEEEVFYDIGVIEQQVRDLSYLCSPSILEHIFYEIHDGDDALTEHSEEFPEVRRELEKLYNTVGFDVLFGCIS